MRRTILVIAVLVLVLSGALALRLRAQAAQLRGPSGGSGEIEGTQVDLAARITARVDALHVKKGDAVRKDQVLISLDCSDTQAALAGAEARLAAAHAQASAAFASADASSRSREASAAVESAARAQAAALASQRDAAQRQASRLEALASDVALSNRDQVRASAEGLGHQVAAAQAQAAASQEQQRAATAAQRAAGAQATAAEASVRVAESEAVRARLLAGECTIHAPRDGLVAELPHETGELVAAGQPLVRLVDLSEVKATFYLPNAELSAIRTGAPAVAVADAWPDETFAGKVSNVAVAAEFTPRNIQTRTDRDRLVYPVEVVIPNAGGKLRPGMPVQITLRPAER